MKRILPLLALLAIIIGVAQSQTPQSADDSTATAAALSNKVFRNVEIPASYPGGSGKMMEFINDSLQYPEEAIDANVSGKVRLQFVVEKDGSISNIKTLESPHSALESEAKRLVKIMPRWNPGTIHDVPVRSYVQFPLTFILPKSE